MASRLAADQFMTTREPTLKTRVGWLSGVGMGMLMLAAGWWGSWLFLRKKEPGRFTLKWFSAMTFSGWVAVLAGWIVTEVGRQPWIVYGLVRTEEIVAGHSGTTVLSTLIGYVVLYLFLLVSYIGALRYLTTRPARSRVLLHDFAGGRRTDAERNY